jgi:hypothetical protein
VERLGVHDERIAFFIVLLVLLGPPVLAVIIFIRRVSGVPWEGGTTTPDEDSFGGSGASGDW